MNSRVMGTCSLCGGRVTVPTIWMGVNPPVPQCESCRAQSASHGPVIEMRPARTYVTDRVVVGKPGGEKDGAP